MAEAPPILASKATGSGSYRMESRGPPPIISHGLNQLSFDFNDIQGDAEMPDLNPEISDDDDEDAMPDLNQQISGGIEVSIGDEEDDPESVDISRIFNDAGGSGSSKKKRSKKKSPTKKSDKDKKPVLKKQAKDNTTKKQPSTFELLDGNLNVSIEDKPLIQAASKKPQERTQYSIQYKLQVVDLLKSEKYTRTAISKTLGMSKKCLRSWLSQETALRAMLDKMEPDALRCKNGGGCRPFYSDVEEKLLEWIKQRRAEGKRVCWADVRDLAIRIAAAMNLTEFKVSNAWVTRFFERHNLKGDTNQKDYKERMAKLRAETEAKFGLNHGKNGSEAQCAAKNAASNALKQQHNKQQASHTSANSGPSNHLANHSNQLHKQNASNSAAAYNQVPISQVVVQRPPNFPQMLNFNEHTPYASAYYNNNNNSTNVPYHSASEFYNPPAAPYTPNNLQQSVNNIPASGSAHPFGQLSALHFPTSGGGTAVQNNSNASNNSSHHHQSAAHQRSNPTVQPPSNLPSSMPPPLAAQNSTSNPTPPASTSTSSNHTPSASIAAETAAHNFFKLVPSSSTATAPADPASTKKASNKITGPTNKSGANETADGKIRVKVSAVHLAMLEKSLQQSNNSGGNGSNKKVVKYRGERDREKGQESSPDEEDFVDASLVQVPPPKRTRKRGRAKTVPELLQDFQQTNERFPEFSVWYYNGLIKAGDSGSEQTIKLHEDAVRNRLSKSSDQEATNNNTHQQQAILDFIKSDPELVAGYAFQVLASKQPTEEAEED